MTADERAALRALANSTAANWSSFSPLVLRYAVRQLLDALDAAEAERDAAIEAARTWENEAERRSQRYIGMVHERDAAIARAESERARTIEECALAAWKHYMDACKQQNKHPGDFGAFIASATIRALAAKGE